MEEKLPDISAFYRDRLVFDVIFLEQCFKVINPFTIKNDMMHATGGGIVDPGAGKIGTICLRQVNKREFVFIQPGTAKWEIGPGPILESQ